MSGYNIDRDTRWPEPHHNFVPEYQQSGIPFAESVELDENDASQIAFNSVTRWIAISSGSACYINFNDNVALFTDNTKAFYIPANTVTRFELKCKCVNVKASADNQIIYVLAALTNIPTKNFPDQTAANGFAVESPAP